LNRWVRDNRLKAVFLIHDLIPLTHPEFCRPGEEAKHRRRMEHVLASASGLIGNSQATIDSLGSFAERNGLSMPPSIVAWIAGHSARSEVAPRFFERPHFVIVGTIEGRKNHRLLLQIWQRLTASYGANAPLLVIVGQRGWEASTAIAMLDRASDLKSHVIELGSCGDEELASIIAGARALLMPSIVEGFGLPVAEALQLGTPVIASDLQVFREFAGDIPTYVDPLDGLAWLNWIVAFAGESAERARQKRALAGYCAPDWPSHFKVVEPWLATISSD
jgi:glycosyltransferase involved in cell wall biosynthesis